MASAAWHRELLMKYLYLSRGDGCLAISHCEGALCPLAPGKGDIKMVTFIILSYYLFIFGCVGSSLLCAGFFQLQCTVFSL